MTNAANITWMRTETNNAAIYGKQVSIRRRPLRLGWQVRVDGEWADHFKTLEAAKWWSVCYCAGLANLGWEAAMQDAGY